MTVEWFVANVPHTWTDDQIRDFIRPSGAVPGPVRRVTEYGTRKPKGFVFIQVDVRNIEDEETCRRSLYGQKVRDESKPEDHEHAYRCVTVEQSRKPRQMRDFDYVRGSA